MKHIKIKEGDYNDVWVTSDTHMGHKNIVKGSSKWDDKSICRDYDSVKDHDQDLIKRINSKVKYNDLLIHLGDWSFGGFENIAKFYHQLECKNIILVLGNHDHHIEDDKDSISSIFMLICDLLKIEYGDYNFICSHYPMETWMGLQKGWFHLFGHQHSSRIGPGRKMDIGIDKGGKMIYPYNIKDLVNILSAIDIQKGLGDSKLEVNKIK